MIGLARAHPLVLLVCPAARFDVEGAGALEPHLTALSADALAAEGVDRPSHGPSMPRPHQRRLRPRRRGGRRRTAAAAAAAAVAALVVVVACR